MNGTRTDGDALRVLLVRHGRTALNVDDRLRGLADPELDDAGVAQARAAAAALRPFGIARVTSSPLRRAMRTADFIAEACGAAHDANPGFTDRDYGPWTGRPRSEVVAEWGSVDAAPGVEPVAAVHARARAALDALARDPGSGVVAVVTHDAVIRPLLDGIEPGIPAAVPTASWAELRYADGRWKVISVDNAAS